jgi:hypothetical protein
MQPTYSKISPANWSSLGIKKDIHTSDRQEYEGEDD